MRRRSRLRGSKLFSRELLTTCTGHGRTDHREITGRLKNGTARSVYAKAYTVGFCTAVVDEMVLAADDEESYEPLADPA